MTDLQIIKELYNRFGELYYEFNFQDNKIIRLELNNKYFIKNKDLELIGELTGLKHLWLQCNEITEIQSLENLTNLQELHLLDNQISTIQGLKKLVNLEWLNISLNNITTIEGLDNLNNLKWLGVSNNNIPEEEIKEFRDNNPKIKVYA